MTAEVVIVTNGNDWDGLYINGRIVMQDHTLDVYQVLYELSKREIINYQFKEILEIQDNDYLPNDISEVQFKK
jgi:hypothetical protein